MILCSIFEVIASEIVVKKMTRSHGHSERFDLKTNVNEKIVLDCQSFIQGLLFGPVGDSVIMLQEWECHELMVDMKRSFSRLKKHCLEVNYHTGELDSQRTCD